MGPNPNGNGEQQRNRRSVLRGMSGLTVGLTGLGAVSGNVGANPPEIDRVEVETATQAIGVARRSSEFKLLRDRLKDEYGLVPSRPSDVLETVDRSERTATIVSFELQRRGWPRDEAGRDADLAIRVRDGSVDTGRATITRYDQDGRPNNVEVLNVVDGGVRARHESLNTADLSVETAVSSGEVSPAFFHETSSCTACKLLYDAACAVGCGVGMAALCLAAGITSVAGSLTCAGIGASVCWFIGRFGCSPTAGYACDYLGFC